jgi:hypothetical protein
LKTFWLQMSADTQCNLFWCVEILYIHVVIFYCFINKSFVIQIKFLVAAFFRFLGDANKSNIISRKISIITYICIYISTCFITTNVSTKWTKMSRKTLKKLMRHIMMLVIKTIPVWKHYYGSSLPNDYNIVHLIPMEDFMFKATKESLGCFHSS